MSFAIVSWIITLAVVFCSVGHSESTPQIQSEIRDGPKNQATARTNSPAQLERGSDGAPVVVVIRKSAEDKEQAEKEENRADDQTAIYRQQMRFNALLVACTILQIILLLIHRREDRANYHTDRRAWVSFRITSISALQAGQFFTFKFGLTNHGQTPARRISFRAITNVVPHNLPNVELPAITGPWNEDLMDLFPNQGDPVMEINCAPMRAMTEAEIQAIHAGQGELRIAVEVRYEDIFMDAKMPRYTRGHFGLSGNFIRIIPGGSRMT